MADELVMLLGKLRRLANRDPNDDGLLRYMAARRDRFSRCYSASDDVLLNLSVASRSMEQWMMCFENGLHCGGSPLITLVEKHRCNFANRH